MEKTFSTQQFPNQKLTEAEKISKFGSLEEWAKEVISSLMGIGSQNHYLSYDDTYRKQINYNLVSGHINEDDFKYVVKPYGVSKYNFPATFTNYNIITPKISLLEGEEAKRPFNFRVVAVDDDSINKINRQKTQMMQQLFHQAWVEELQNNGVDIQDDKAVQQSTPEEIQKFFSTDYKTEDESNAQESLEYLMRYLDLKSLFNEAWRDLLITGEEIYWVGIVSNEPYVELVNSVYFRYDKNPDLKYIEDAAWAYREYFIPASDVYDRWGEYLTEEQVEKIELAKGGITGNTVTNSSINIPIRYDSVDRDGYTGFTTIDSNVFVNVVHCEWKGLKKIGFVTFTDDNGEEQTVMVDETYKPTPNSGETVEWRWINTVYEATRILDDIMVNVREKPNQYRSMDNPSRCKLGYTGIVYNAKNSQSYSLVEVMKPHQYLYNIIMYRLELEIARAKGKKTVFDIAQLPVSQGFDFEKWLYYFDVMGLQLINSFEEGKGKFAGQRPSFNQFQEIDLSLARVIDQYIMMLDKIEQMVGEISGVTRQRQGEINSSETVGGVERSVQQSSYITEPLFMAHNAAKQHVLTSLLDCAKLAWLEGKKINFVKDDLTRALIMIDGTEFMNAEHGVFVSDNANDNNILQTIKQLAQSAMQSGQATLMDIVGIMESQNVHKAKKILKDTQDKAMQMQQEQAQREQEQAQAQLQAQMASEQAKLQSADMLNQRDNDTKIQVAIIQYESSEGGDTPELKAAVETEKLRIQERKNKRDADIKERKMEGDRRIAERKVELDAKIREEELEEKEKLEQMYLEAERKALEKSTNAEIRQGDRSLDIELTKHEKDIKQQDKEHQREQKTDIAKEKIKADATVKAAKAKPKPKSND